MFYFITEFVISMSSTVAAAQQTNRLTYSCSVHRWRVFSSMLVVFLSVKVFSRRYILPWVIYSGGIILFLSLGKKTVSSPSLSNWAVQPCQVVRFLFNWLAIVEVLGSSRQLHRILPGRPTLVPFFFIFIGCLRTHSPPWLGFPAVWDNCLLEIIF